MLACAGGADEPLSVGEVAAAFADAAAGDDGESARAAVAALAAERPELVLAVRRCCMDGFCTLVCPDGIDARGVFSALRVLLHEARLTGDDGFTMTRVDQEWHIFSAYRAVHGIFYNDLPSLENARAWGADTLFFPGCSLVSYAPELTREVFAWLQEQGASVALSADCCGSPLRSGGFTDRCEAHKAALVSRAREAGIKRVVFVCPGLPRRVGDDGGRRGVRARCAARAFGRRRRAPASREGGGSGRLRRSGARDVRLLPR